jgi:hypothetical protein
MRVRGAIVALAGSLSAAAVAAPASLPSPEFAVLVARLKTGDAAIDYARFRALAPKEPGFDPDFDPSAIVEARRGGDQAAVRRLTETRVAQDPSDLAARYWLSEACERLGDLACARREAAVFDGMIAAINASGDGEGAKSALSVIRVPEEYIWLGLRRLTSTGQSLIADHGRYYDVLHVRDAAGAERDVWFDISAFAPEAP